MIHGIRFSEHTFFSCTYCTTSLNALHLHAITHIFLIGSGYSLSQILFDKYIYTSIHLYIYTYIYIYTYTSIFNFFVFVLRFISIFLLSNIYRGCCKLMFPSIYNLWATLYLKLISFFFFFFFFVFLFLSVFLVFCMIFQWNASVSLHVDCVLYWLAIAITSAFSTPNLRANGFSVRILPSIWLNNSPIRWMLKRLVHFTMKMS